MAPPKKTASRPGRAIAALVVLIIVMLLAIVGKDAFTPSHWRHDFRVQLGLDLAGGTSVTEQAQTITGKTPSASDMAQARAIMIARVNGAGFSGAQVQQQGSNDMVITVPGANTQKVVKLVGVTAQLFFRQVLLVGGRGSTATPSSTSTTTPATSPTSPATSPTTAPSVSPSPGTKASGTSSPKADGAVRPAGQSGGHRLASGSRLLAAAKLATGKTGKPKPKASTPGTSASPSPSPSPSTTAPASQVAGDASLVSPAVLKEFNKLDCTKANWKQQIGYSTAIYDNPNRQIVACANPGVGYAPGTKFALDTAKVLGKWVTGAQAGTASSQTSLSDKWQVNFSLNSQGTTAFGNLTSRDVQQVRVAGQQQPAG